MYLLLGDLKCFRQFSWPQTATTTIQSDWFAVDRTILDFRDAPLGAIGQGDDITLGRDKFSCHGRLFLGGCHYCRPFQFLVRGWGSSPVFPV